MSIRSRTLLGYAVLMALVFLAGGIGLLHAHSVDDALDAMNLGADRIQYLTDLRIRWLSLLSSVDEMILTRQSSLAGTDVSQRLYELTTSVRETGRSFGEADSSYAELSRCVESVPGVISAISEAAVAGGWARAQVLRHTELASLQRRFEQILRSLQERNRSQVMLDIEATRHIQQRTRTGLFLMVLFALVFGPVAAGITASSIVRPIEFLAGAVRSLEPEGLKQKLVFDRRDEIGELALAYNLMTEKLHQVLTGLEEQINTCRLVEGALRTSESRYRSLFEHSPISLWELDLAGSGELAGNAATASCREPIGSDPHAEAQHVGGISVVAVNRSTLDLMEAVDEPDTGRLCRRISEDLGSHLARALRVFAGGGTAYGSEARITTLKGRTLDVIAHIAVPPEQAGLFSRVFVSILDMTARKEMEQALRKSEEQYYRAQKMEAVGRLTGGVAHDFNNILTVIIGNCDIALSERGIAPSLVQRIEQIRSAGLRAASVTEQLLAFSHQRVSKPGPVALASLVRGISDMLERILGENIELVLDLEHPVPTVIVDPGHMEQVIMNLAVNARDAMPEGGRLGISLFSASVDEAYCDGHPDASPGEHAVLEVSDTGTGIEAEIIGMIFDPFFTTKDRGKGTGLGLATVQGIITDSRGWIDLKSAPGAGTVFRIFLPGSDLPPGEPVERKTTETVGPGASTILLVEDEEAVREVTSAALRLNGYRVLEASDADGAFRLFTDAAGEIDLLVTDIILSGSINGIRIARELRERKPDLGILFISGYATEEIERTGGLSTNAEFLSKPFSTAAFLARVAEVIGAGPARPPGSPPQGPHRV